MGADREYRSLSRPSRPTERPRGVPPPRGGIGGSRRTWTALLGGTAPALGPHAWEALASRLQQSSGNAAVQRLIERHVRPVTRALQREATRPRAATGTDAVADLRSHTTAAGAATAGSLARQEWESLFRRHFVEPDRVEDEVESSHARYLYSRVYGWIDAQHFFAHIQFAEDRGLAGATAQGLAIEHKQQRVRDLIGPSRDDTSIYSEFLRANLITPDDFLHYRESLFIAISLGMDMVLSDQERALIRGFDDRQLAKLILDSAMSAWSAEDLVSNQLGVQFFRLHGGHVNAGRDAVEVRRRFIDRISEFFASIQVVNDPATVRRLARSLPGKERWTSAKMSEATARRRHPELFAFGGGTHRLRIAVYDRRATAERGLALVRDAAPSARGLRVEPYGVRFALYSAPLSHFEAVVLKHAVDRAVRTGRGGALVRKAGER